MTPWRQPLLLAALAAGGAAALFATAQQPFLWTFALWTVLAFTGALRSRTTTPKVLLVNAATVLLVLAAYEAFLWVRDRHGDPTRMEGTYTRDYFVGDELLGYGPKKAIVATAAKFHENDVVYRVEYTIGADGLRVAPPVAEPARGCVLFFGGSVTFGEGVADDQAMPYQVGTLTGNRFRIYNFGFHGYGPHQMLAALERGRVEEIVRCRPSHVIYQAIIPHVERAAGLASWDRHGPRYVSVPAGGVRRAGHFDDEETAHPWKQWLRRWLTYDTLFGRRRAARPAEIALFADIVDAARTHTERVYPAAQFHILVWDNTELPAHDAVLSALQARDLRLHRMTDILPGYRADTARYELGPFDPHPAAATHAAIARYVVTHILGVTHGPTMP